jgi:hypothetical protein
LNIPTPNPLDTPLNQKVKHRMLVMSDRYICTNEASIIAIERLAVKAQILPNTVRNKMHKSTECRKGPIRTVNFNGGVFTDIVIISTNHIPASIGSCVMFVMVWVKVA